MEKRMESFGDIIDRLFRSSAGRGALARRSAPAVHHHAPDCMMTDGDKEFAAGVLRAWLNLADVALGLERDIRLLSMEENVAQDAILRCNEVAERLRAHPEQRREVALLRFKIEDGEFTRARTRSMMIRRNTELLTGVLDAMEPMAPVVDKITKYGAKLNLAALGILRVLDGLEDRQFAEEVARSLAG